MATRADHRAVSMHQRRRSDVPDRNASPTNGASSGPVGKTPPRDPAVMPAHRGAANQNRRGGVAVILHDTVHRTVLNERLDDSSPVRFFADPARTSLDLRTPCTAERVRPATIALWLQRRSFEDEIVARRCVNVQHTVTSTMAGRLERLCVRRTTTDWLAGGPSPDRRPSPGRTWWE